MSDLEEHLENARIVECIERHAALKAEILETAAILHAVVDAPGLTLRRGEEAMRMARELESLEEKVDEEHDCSIESYTRLRGEIRLYNQIARDLLREAFLKQAKPRAGETGGQEGREKPHTPAGDAQSAPSPGSREPS